MKEAAMAEDPTAIQASETPDTHELVPVFDTADETEAFVVHGLLGANDIESMVTPLDAPQDVLPGVGGNMVKVRADQAEEARAVIAAYRSTTLDEVEAAEAESEGSTPEDAA
jgi:hypothetical protein